MINKAEGKRKFIDEAGFLQVRENWKKSGNLLGQGKSGKVRENLTI